MTAHDQLLARLDAKPNGVGHKALCPAHDDSSPSLSIKLGDNGGTLFYCHAGCTHEAVAAALGLSVADLFAPKVTADKSAPITLAQLAEHKRLDVGFLRSLGLREERGGVVIPYKDADGNEVAAKRRTNLVAKNGSFWPKNTPLTVYGAERLADARELDRLFLVEGESDCWTLWQHSVPALGIPGASSTRTLEAAHVAGVASLYCVQEPDAGGERFVAGLCKRLDEIGFAGAAHVVWLEGAKDPSELHAQDPPSFTRRLELAIARAQPLSRLNARVTAPIARPASSIPMVRVDWLWPGRIPAAMVTIFDGDPGLGKSTITNDITARITTGRPMPGESVARAPADVVLVSFEDHPGAVVVPRLKAAGADLSRVHVWDTAASPFSLRDSLSELEQLITETRARLVVVDPLMAALPADVNTHRDQDVRAVLAMVSAMAETTGAAVLLVRHLNKSGGGSALYRGGGSIGIVAAARAGLLLAKADGDDPDARVLAMTKNNLARMPSALALRLVSAPSPMPGVEVATVEWGGTVTLHADELVEEPSDRTALAEAAAIVRDILSAGPKLAKDVETEATAAGVSKASLRRAKTRLGVRSERATTTGPWSWSLPGEHT